MPSFKLQPQLSALLGRGKEILLSRGKAAGPHCSPSAISLAPRLINLQESEDCCFVARHACPSGQPGSQECQEVGISLTLGLSLCPLCSWHPLQPSIFHLGWNQMVTITNQFFTSTAALPSNTPQCQPLTSLSPHFTHSAKFPQILHCGSSAVPLQSAVQR